MRGEDGERVVSVQRFKLVSDDVKRHVCRQIVSAEWGCTVTIAEPTKSRDQEAKYHAMFADIARQCEFMGQKWSVDDWKRLLVDAFARVMQQAGTPLRHDGRIVPSLDGCGVVQLGVQTRKFLKAEASEFIEYLHAWGAERGVRWSASEWEFA